MAEEKSVQSWVRSARLANLVLPIGWLPLGVMAAGEGNVGPAILGFLGMTLIGAASLWRAYRTTVRLYQGDFTSQTVAPRPVAARAAVSPQPPAPRMLEAALPGLSEPVSAIALTGFRSLIRAPEAKMMLLTPVIFVAGFWLHGFENASGRARLRFARSSPSAPIGIALFGVLQLMSNQFGFDRDGFRVFVLCAAPRRDILLGKNLSFAPLALASWPSFC